MALRQKSHVPARGPVSYTQFTYGRGPTGPNVASIKTRLQKLEQYIAELKKQQSLSFEQFERDFTVQLAVERAFQAESQ